MACTGQPTEVIVRTSSYEVPFRRGKAVVNVDAYACGGGAACVPVEIQKDLYLL